MFFRALGQAGLGTFRSGFANPGLARGMTRFILKEEVIFNYADRLDAICRNQHSGLLWEE